MKKTVFFLFILLLISFFSCQDEDTIEPDPIPTETNKLLQLNGNQLVDSNKNSVYLEGVAFGNEIWNNSPYPIETHHNELDFERVKNMGMNTIRFYLNYRTFEDDSNPYQYKQTGWDYLDKNIAWAKKHNIYLILNMHAPQGGYQSQGNGDALWTNTENQNRLAALWKAIAERYKDETSIAGFGFVNEPVPTNSMAQWSQLAQKITDEVRKVDKNHLLFMERAIYVKGNFEPDANLNFPVIQDDKVIYEFHGYEPFKYSHQLLDFANLGDGGAYPDENILEGFNSQWYSATFDNPKVASGNSNWTFIEGNTYKITDPKIKIAYPTLVGAEVGGKVYFDDIIIKEFDENGNFTQIILEKNLNDLNGWYYWSSNNSGTFGIANGTGNSDAQSIYIENATNDCNLNNSSLSFIPKQNYSYQINGYAKGENISNSANCKFRIDFETSDSPIYKRNKEYLESVISEISNWAAEKNFALYMGEFGLGYHCFENNKGGLTYVKDMVSIAKEKNIHFSYHAYHEELFGIYRGGGSLPDPNNANQPLIDLFTEILN
jgi:endoglucanase